MTSLEEAWTWYENTREQLELLRRLGTRYWSALPWENCLDRDDRFRLLQGDQVVGRTTFSLAHLDDLAVVVLFSAFESVVRMEVLDEVRKEARGIRHRSLQHAVEEAMTQIEEGSFFRVLEPFKTTHADLVEEVNQVRRYRNWVAHGKRGTQPNTVTPEGAFDRLTRFLNAFRGEAGPLPS